jgi:hypothetical protein
MFGRGCCARGRPSPQFDGGEELSERTRWSRFQSAALRDLAAQEDNLEKAAQRDASPSDAPGEAPESAAAPSDATPTPRSLRRYGWRDHGRVAAKAALENLAVLPFWAVKVQAMTACGRAAGVHPYPWRRGGCLAALRSLVAEEGLLKGLFKGALPMLTLGKRLAGNPPRS